MTAANRTEFCVEVSLNDTAQPIYTVRIKGRSFAAPVRAEGTYTVRVFDQDHGFEELHKGLRAQQINRAG